MPTVTFTARTVHSLQAKRGRRTEYFDPSVPGLALRVTPTGAKCWTLLYRHRARLRRLTLGDAKVVTLAEARTRARDLLHDVTKGADPATDKQAGRTVATIADLAALYITKWAKPKKRSWKADDNLLRHRVLPRWQHRAIVDITRQDVRQLVEAVAEDGAPIVANRVAALLSKLFMFALDRDLVTASPAVRIPRPGTETARDRVLTEDEIRAFWTTCDAFDVPMAAFYQLRLLTAQRGGEVASMRWQDVDLDSRWWTIPASDSKNKLAHRVPLNSSAVQIITDLKAGVDESERTRTEPIGPVTRERLMYVVAGARGKRQQSDAAATFTVPDFRGHDLRRTAASLMAGGGIPRLVIGKILNHVERDITAVYDRHTYDLEKTAALTWWGVKLTAILEQKDASTVLPFQRGA